ncbi:permease-like cell division protein FtsX [Parvimonas sp. D9]|uniref:permease-like cell division protein FtsX n=1 Tax=Parvimonas sp. D9 TaxID=3110689 RepID=UPI002B491A67|nr:permease-like cell division protein FtsX [Parvimonas sp. D9]MEB3058383.1 permease-like cell division protein FtsX [Parvimonas sp. D9]
MSSIRRFFSAIGEGLVGLWRNKSMGVASIVSICSMLLILGGITFGVFVANNIVEDMKTKVDQIDVILEPEVTHERVLKIKEELKKIENVKEVNYVSKEKALEKMKEQWKENSFLLDGMESALPESYELKVENIENSSTVASNIYNIKDVEKVVYYKDIVDKLTKMSDVVKYVGITLVGVLLLVSFFIMSITIKLTVIARRKEISIKKYIGATNMSITGPFIVEGMLLGVLGAGISFVMIFFAYKYVYESLAWGVGNILYNYLIPVNIFGFYVAIAYFGIGIGIGILASIFSSRKYMKV